MGYKPMPHDVLYWDACWREVKFERDDAWRFPFGGDAGGSSVG